MACLLFVLLSCDCYWLSGLTTGGATDHQPSNHNHHTPLRISLARTSYTINN